MIRFISIRLLICLVFVTLVSCATVKQQAATKPEVSVVEVAWVAEQKKREQIKIWEVRGRLGVQTETNGGSMDIIWKQSGEDFSIRLIAPLGAGSYLIQGDNEVIEIRYPDGNKEIIDNIDDVFASTLEVDLPVTVIKDWIRGLPAHALSVEKISWNKLGLLHKTKQAGWNVEMTKYTGKKTPMPHAIYISRDDNIDLDIRLVLRQWLLDN